MAESASYECMLSRLSEDNREGISHWDGFWDFTKKDNDCGLNQVRYGTAVTPILRVCKKYT